MTRIHGEVKMNPDIAARLATHSVVEMVADYINSLHFFGKEIMHFV